MAEISFMAKTSWLYDFFTAFLQQAKQHKALYYLLLPVLLLNSCAMFTPPHSIKKNFTNCYDGKSTGIEKVLKVDGYYRMKYIAVRYTQVHELPIKRWGIVDQDVYEDPKYVREVDTLSIYFMPYRDGSVVYNFFDYQNNIEGYFRNIKSDINEKHSFERSFYWGKYTINKDTIKIQWINHPYPMGEPWLAREEVFKLKNDSTLQFIYERDLDTGLANSYKYKPKKSEDNWLDATFTPTTERPDSTNWLRNKKWFRCK